MWKVATLVHIMAMTVLMGVLVLVILSVPSLTEQGMRLIPVAALIGFVVGIPFCVVAAKAILARTAGR
ncbi:MAG TPA: hypothetical protein PK812_11940 [Beijerinckiaceae bacterium]|nr:hypothetical protein [Beijerinckiaceae bacterium]